MNRSITFCTTTLVSGTVGDDVFTTDDGFTFGLVSFPQLAEVRELAEENDGYIEDAEVEVDVEVVLDGDDVIDVYVNGKSAGHARFSIDLIEQGVEVA